MNRPSERPTQQRPSPKQMAILVAISLAVGSAAGAVGTAIAISEPRAGAYCPAGPPSAAGDEFSAVSPRRDGIPPGPPNASFRPDVASGWVERIGTRVVRKAGLLYAILSS